MDRIDRCRRPSWKAALGTKPTGVLKHCRTILGNVFVEQDAHAAIAQQSRQRRLAVEDEEIAQILAIMRDQVEGIRDRGTRGSSANGPPQRGRRRRRPRRSSFSCGKRWKYNACEVAEPMLVAASVVADAAVDGMVPQ